MGLKTDMDECDINSALVTCAGKCGEYYLIIKGGMKRTTTGLGSRTHSATLG